MDGHWWFGKGYLVNPKVEAYGFLLNHAHNSYLASLRDGGLVGLALMLAILGLAGLWAFRLYRQRGERLYLALLLYGMTCITMDFDRLLVHPKEMWLFFWLPVALIMASYPHRHAPGPVRYAARSL
jgi:O-antigen ligase